MQMKQQRVQYFINAIGWCFNGKYHRDEDLPAVYYFKDEDLIAVRYFQYNNFHLTTGPAVINYWEKIKKYCYEGREYDSLEEMLMLEACR